MLTFAQLQKEHKEWADRNFGPSTPENAPHRHLHTFLGVVEEVGELAHSLLKQHQGIRGSHEEHEANAKDAVADVIIFLTDLCNRKGWSLQLIMESTWNLVKNRDWTRDKASGRGEGEGITP